MGGYVHAQLLGAIRNAHFFASAGGGKEAGDAEGANAATIEPLRPVDGQVAVPVDSGLGFCLDGVFTD
jgi:hypothetical protein